MSKAEFYRHDGPRSHIIGQADMPQDLGVKRVDWIKVGDIVDHGPSYQGEVTEIITNPGVGDGTVQWFTLRLRAQDAPWDDTCGPLRADAYLQVRKALELAR